MKSKSFFFNSIQFRLTLTLLVLLLLVGLSYMAITAFAARNYFLETTQRVNAHVAEHLIHEVAPFKEGVVNEEALGTIMHSMMAVNPAIEVYLLDKEGSILSFVVLDKDVKLKKVSMDPIHRFIEANGQRFIEGDDPRNPGKQVVFSSAPVEEGGQLLGYVYIVLQSEEYETANGALFGSYFLRVGTMGFGIALLVAFGLGVGLIVWLTRSIRHIQRSVETFGAGDYHARIEVRKGDEMEELATTINRMADTILQNIEDLKQVDSLRRELIANVSHDLRSPMTVIHGFVETYMMKRDTLTEDEHKRYLEAIIVNSEKLRKLVADLFELSKLEAKQVKLQKEPVAVSEMLAELCDYFSVVAENKGAKFYADIPKDMLQIDADPMLLSRVLQNLLDNAIKYVNVGGRVHVSLKSHQGYAELAMMNTGEGIPAQDLPLVFNRYFKASKAKDNHSTGLGLAIVKHIVALHEGAIQATSEPGKETVFSLRLPITSNATSALV
ncbi:MAG: hypothetical protein RLZZ262_1947 [Bacteroidota bacterium]|jgi:signal transduction histidine kinase